MQSNNPVFRRSEEFNQSSPYGQTSYPGYAPSPQGYGGEPGTQAPPTADRMTIDSVVMAVPVIQQAIGSDPKLPFDIGVPLEPKEAQQLAASVSKTWPAAKSAP